MSQSNRDDVTQQMKTETGNISVVGQDNSVTISPTQIVQYIIKNDEILQKPFKKESPYRGFESFLAENKEYFFGRSRLIRQLLDAVEQNNLVLVTGASGSGKSSIVQAGLIPQWKNQNKQYYNFIFTPDDNPFKQFRYHGPCQYLKNSHNIDREQTINAEKVDINTLKNVVQTIKKKESEKWLFFIDQFEEIFTMCDEKESNIFVKSLNQLTKLNDPSIKIVLAIRSDFLEKFDINSDLRELLNENKVEIIGDMTPEELREAIEQPAAKNGVIFEDGLVQQILEDIHGTDRNVSIQKGYLPSLQYTLETLWNTQNLNSDERKLKRQYYSEIGGVRGSLEKQIQEIYAKFSEEEKDATRSIFLNLFDIQKLESEDKLVRKRVNSDNFSGKMIEHTLKTFIDKKLLVSDSVKNSDRHQPIVEVAHESLLGSLDSFGINVEEVKKEIITKKWLDEATQRWVNLKNGENSGQADDELVRGYKLSELVDLRETNAFDKLGGLTTEQNNYIDESKNREEKEKEESRKRKEERRRLEEELRQREIERRQHELELEIERRQQAEERYMFAQQKLKQTKKITRLTLSILGTVLILGSLSSGLFWLQQQQQQQAERDRLIRDAALNVTTPELVRSLAKRLPEYLQVADRDRKKGNIDKALADYQFLVSLKSLEDRIQRKPSEEKENFNDLNREREIIQKTSSQAEILLADIIQKHRFPKLEAELRKGNFGKSKEPDFSKFEDQYTEALKVTYMILMREFGANADLNNDGYLSDGEENIIPCDTLDEIEELWRKFTDNRCGWYGTDSVYEEPACHELDGLSLSRKLLFPPSIPLVEERISKQCKVIPSPTKEVNDEQG